MPIRLDEYDTTGPGPYPVMVLVHGGGWWRGCRTTLQHVAWEASGRGDPYGLPQYFIVLNIDYRLACRPDDPNLVGSPIRYLCGWDYPRMDPATGTRGAAIHDVQDAIRWVRSTWQHLPGRPSWNGRVVVLGTSAGGTLTYHAVAPSPTVGGSVASDVNAVASWSGHHELDLMNNNKWPCEPGQSNNPPECAQGINQFLGCTSVYPDPVCITSGIYTDATTITHYLSPATLPPAFFGNAGGPIPGVSPPEIVALQSAIDLRDSLVANTWPPNEYQLCVVNSQVHGRGLRGHPCNDGTQTVWWRTSEFLSRSF